MDVETIKIEGSVELAPLLELADAIVDIVETGSTLKENGLEVIEDVAPISARVIVNLASAKLKKSGDPAHCGRSGARRGGEVSAMFLKTVQADGTAEKNVIREMKQRAAAARSDIEKTVAAVMADVQARGMEAVKEYAEKFDGVAPYEVTAETLEAAYARCDRAVRAALERAAANIRDYHEQMLARTWEYQRSPGACLGRPCAA